MTAARPAAILRQLQPDAATDAELLARFLRRDEAAFAGLVRRHGPMILAVCRRITRHTQDAEDAFQAVFLILAKKAATVREPRLLGNWLYGVAVRVAQKARRGAIRRRAREVQTVNAPEPLAPPAETNAERDAVLHEELATLPAKFREPIVLCDLRGITRTEAAELLGIPVGTLSSRLSAGREKLAGRLHRRGIAMGAAAIPAALAENAAASLLPDSLVVKTCGLVAGWQAGAAIPAPVLQLMQGGLSMRATVLMGMLGVAFAATGLVLAASSEEPPPKPETPVVKATPTDAKEAKEDGFTTKPRLQRMVDLPITDIESIVWSPTGDAIAILGRESMTPPQPPRRDAIVYRLSEKQARYYWIKPQESCDWIGFTPDGKEVITPFQENGLISGRHELQFWRLDPDRPLEEDKPRIVNVGTETIQGFAFSADGKTFRTFLGPRSESKNGAPIEVREISTETGKTLRTLLKTNELYRGRQLAANGKRLVAADKNGGIDVWNVDAGQKESTPRKASEVEAYLKKHPDVRKEVGGVPPSIRQMSADSRYLLILDFEGARIYDTETRQFTPKLERGSDLEVVIGSVNFSPKSQLLVIMGSYRIDVPDPDFSESLLSIWEVNTGKLVKSWPGQADAAWSPVAPVLAVIEPNGQGGTRLGLWDFSNESK